MRKILELRAARPLMLKINRTLLFLFHLTQEILHLSNSRHLNLFDNLPDHLMPKSFDGKRIYLLTDQPLTSINSNFWGLEKIDSITHLSQEEVNGSIFYIYFLFDSDAIVQLQHIQRFGGVFIPPRIYSKTQYRYINKLASQAMQLTDQDKRISHYSDEIHSNICEALQITKNIEGDYLEIGVYRGGSALTALNFYSQLAGSPETPKKKFYFADTFDGFLYEDAEKSVDASWAGTHELFGVANTMRFVSEILDQTGVPYELLALNICQSDIPPEIMKLSVVNIDVDMYEATFDALRKVSRLVVSGGIIICEDPASTPGTYGALLAMEQFLETKQGSSFTKVFKSGQYFLIKR